MELVIMELTPRRGRVTLRLVCSCGWGRTQEPNDPKGTMLEILKGIHESTFKDHVCKIDEV